VYLKLKTETKNRNEKLKKKSNRVEKKKEKSIENMKEQIDKNDLVLLRVSCTGHTKIPIAMQAGNTKRKSIAVPLTSSV